MTDVPRHPEVVRLPRPKPPTTDDEENEDTPASDWDYTADLDEDACEERERLRAKLGLVDHAPRPMIDARYEIRGRQGQGGMGVVYHARDLRLDRDVALKLVRVRPFSDEARLRDRLEREAKALAKLDGHDHVVAVYDVGRLDDRIYFTMPYIQGVDLRQWQDVRPRTVDELIDVYLQAARGLAAAHAHGIVHRDFKPANVLVRAEDQRVLVADFGIAEAIGVVDDPPDGHETMLSEALRLTATGAMLGTLPYVAPERLPTAGQVPARGAPASDQFSFCVSLWEALAGEVPFLADSPAQMLAAVEMPPRGAAGIPRWLRPLLRRGLARNPADRFPSMDELILAIERRRHLTVKAALIALGLAVIVGVLAWASIAERRQMLSAHHHLVPESMVRWLAAATCKSKEHTVVKHLLVENEITIQLTGYLDPSSVLQFSHWSGSLADNSDAVQVEHEGASIQIKLMDFTGGGYTWQINATHTGTGGTANWSRGSNHAQYTFTQYMNNFLEVSITASNGTTTKEKIIDIKTKPRGAPPHHL